LSPPTRAGKLAAERWSCTAKDCMLLLMSPVDPLFMTSSDDVTGASACLVPDNTTPIAAVEGDVTEYAVAANFFAAALACADFSNGF
jgi:hypothetical protein